MDNIVYKPFSKYPFIIRDVTITGGFKFEHPLCIQKTLLSNFGEKETYRLVFQAMDRTLTKEEVNDIIETIV